MRPATRPPSRGPVPFHGISTGSTTTAMHQFKEEYCDRTQATRASSARRCSPLPSSAAVSPPARRSGSGSHQQRRRHLHVLGPVPPVRRHRRLDQARRAVRHRGRRHRQAHRLRHQRPDQQGAPRRPAGQLARPAAGRQPRRLDPGRGGHPDHHRREQARHVATSRRTSSAAGEIDGKTYGVPIGANTLALYYNKNVLKAAGVDIASVTDWASLTAALAKVTAAGKKGITFSGIGTEEGSFQFLPWFWGSGADLTELDSTRPSQALTLWTDWVKKGYAPNSVINNTQTTSWQEFVTGDFAFGENGTWQLGERQEGRDRLRHPHRSRRSTAARPPRPPAASS